MPSRHISPQSFDEILSELGDDPAIPDPHGIRKSGSPKAPPKKELLTQVLPMADLKKIGALIALGIGMLGLGLILFATYESQKTTPDNLLQDSQKEISEIKNELGFLREEILVIEDDLYGEIDSLEVSIHSLIKNKPSSISKPKPQSIPFEAELRRWRYLGLSQIGSSHRAFFHNGKGALMLEKGAILLGDWKLSAVDKELAILTHSQGKSLTLQSTKTE